LFSNDSDYHLEIINIILIAQTTALIFN